MRWRRGSPNDTVTTVALARRGGTDTDSVVVRFASGQLFTETPPVNAGIYDISANGGTSVLVVNQSAEVRPKRPSVVDGEIATGEALTDAPRLRGLGWIFAIVILSLCGEWMLRKRLGLR